MSQSSVKSDDSKDEAPPVFERVSNNVAVLLLKGIDALADDFDLGQALGENRKKALRQMVESVYQTGKRVDFEWPRRGRLDSNGLKDYGKSTTVQLFLLLHIRFNITLNTLQVLCAGRRAAETLLKGVFEKASSCVYTKDHIVKKDAQTMCFGSPKDPKSEEIIYTGTGIGFINFRVVNIHRQLESDVVICDDAPLPEFFSKKYNPVVITFKTLMPVSLPPLIDPSNLVGKLDTKVVESAYKSIYGAAD